MTPPSFDQPRLCFDKAGPLFCQKALRIVKIVYAVAMKLNLANRKALVGHQMAFLTIIGLWLFHLLITSLRAAVMEFPAQGELAMRRLVVTAIGIVLTWLLYLFLRFFDRKPLGTRVAAAFIGAIPCAIAIAWANYFLFNIYDPISLFDDPTLGKRVEELDAALGFSAWQEVAEIAITRYFFIIAWASLFLALGYAREVREAERKASRYAQAAQDAELRSLRYQVNPHFLFNTLNSLSSLVIKGQPKEAEAMIQNLSTFYRNSLSSDPLEDVTLEDEVELQRLYLDIEVVRYPKRLRTEINIDPDLMKAHVPALILQPLVENAIRYAVSLSSKPVTIAIEAKRQGNKMEISVTDDGEPFDGNGGGSGIGLANVRDRLETRYGSKAKLKTEARAKGGFVATLTIPLEN